MGSLCQLSIVFVLVLFSRHIASEEHDAAFKQDAFEFPSDLQDGIRIIPSFRSSNSINRGGRRSYCINCSINGEDVSTKDLSPEEEKMIRDMVYGDLHDRIKEKF